jgi:hypothetical protein
MKACAITLIVFLSFTRACAQDVICFSRVELEAAADSALKEQDARRRLILELMLSRSYVDKIEHQNQLLQNGDSLLTKERENVVDLQDKVDLLTKQYLSLAKKKPNRLLWIGIGSAITYGLLRELDH